MRPIRARKPPPHVGQKWVGAVLLVLAALSLRNLRDSLIYDTVQFSSREEN